jgi:UDP-glucose 4-epimerase
VLTLPVPLLKIALTIGKFLRMTRYGPEQLNFLRYRPVLTNKALVEDFGYRPEKSSAEVLQLFADGINQEKAL